MQGYIETLKKSMLDCKKKESQHLKNFIRIQ